MWFEVKLLCNRHNRFGYRRPHRFGRSITSGVS
jgi:hypothetical protein